MQLEYAKDPKWSNPQHTAIDLIVKFDAINRELPFTADPNDVEEHGRQIYANCIAGQYGSIAEYIPPVPVPPTAQENKVAAIEALQQTDWVNQPDVTNPAINPHLINHAAFISYRAALRAIAVNPQPGNLSWPVKPDEQWSAG
jgi:hypothetical protein